MLGFFRKHQKFFFIFVTCIIVISFTFFGTFSSLLSNRAAPDKVVGVAVDGSSIYQNELRALTYLLDGGHEQKGYVYTGKMPLLLNDGVILKEFFLTKTGNILAQKYFSLIKDDLQERMQRIQHYKHYTHPSSSMVSAEKVWEQFLPEVNTELKSLREMKGDVTPEVFTKLCNLYVEQSKFPPEFLKRFVFFAESQHAGGKNDPQLQNVDLSLFGFHSLEDWFGKSFLEISAQFILNTSLIAEKKGYTVSLEEARRELYQNTYLGLQGIVKKEELTSLDLGQYVRHELQAVGLNEEEGVKLWRKVLLFKRFFHEASESVFVDPLMHQQFASYAGVAALVDEYQLPEHLRLRDFRALAKLQVYVEAVAKTKTALLLPRSYLSVDEVEKKAPELVQRTFTMEVAEIKKEDLCLNISLKELLEWKLKEENFELLKSAFPILASKKAETREERFAVLEKLDPKERLKMDRFVRNKIVDLHPEWIDIAFGSAPLEKETVSLRVKGSHHPFKGLTDTKQLLNTLLSYQGTPLRFTGDKEHFYTVKTVEKSSERQILTFVEANRDGTLDEMLTHRLEALYDGAKPFNEVRDQLALKLYPELFKAIQEDTAKTLKKENSPSLDFYVTHRLYAYMRDAEKALEKNPSDPYWVASEKGPLTLENQWHLVKTEKEITRGEASGKEDLFSLKENTFSKMHFGSRGDLSFSYLKGKSVKEEIVLEKVQAVKEALGVEAKRALMQEIVNEISLKKGIVLQQEDVL